MTLSVQQLSKRVNFAFHFEKRCTMWEYSTLFHITLIKNSVSQVRWISVCVYMYMCVDCWRKTCTHLDSLQRRIFYSLSRSYGLRLHLKYSQFFNYLFELYLIRKFLSHLRNASERSPRLFLGEKSNSTLCLAGGWLIMGIRLWVVGWESSRTFNTLAKVLHFKFIRPTRKLACLLRRMVDCRIDLQMKWNAI